MVPDLSAVIGLQMRRIYLATIELGTLVPNLAVTKFQVPSNGVRFDPHRDDLQSRPARPTWWMPHSRSRRRRRSRSRTPYAVMVLALSWEEEV